MKRSEKLSVGELAVEAGETPWKEAEHAVIGICPCPGAYIVQYITPGS